MGLPFYNKVERLHTQRKNTVLVLDNHQVHESIWNSSMPGHCQESPTLKTTNTKYQPPKPQINPAQHPTCKHPLQRSTKQKNTEQKSHPTDFGPLFPPSWSHQTAARVRGPRRCQRWRRRGRAGIFAPGSYTQECVPGVRLRGFMLLW